MFLLHCQPLTRSALSPASEAHFEFPFVLAALSELHLFLPVMLTMILPMESLHFPAQMFLSEFPATES